MAASGIKLLDANVWLAVAFSDHQHHAKAKEWFEAQADQTCAFCRITQLALLRHLTNSRIMGNFVQTQQQARQVYANLTSDPRVISLGEPMTLDGKFREFTQQPTPAHERWTDAYLAAFAVSVSAQLVTCDQGFDRNAGLDLTVLAELPRRT
jgi:uncharacterized protein